MLTWLMDKFDLNKNDEIITDNSFLRFWCLSLTLQDLVFFAQKFLSLHKYFLLLFTGGSTIMLGNF